MRLGCIMAASLVVLFGGCQMCDNCSDYAPPASFTAPGEMYSGALLPPGPPVVPQVIPPGATEAQPMPATPPVTPEAEEPEIPMALRQ